MAIESTIAKKVSHYEIRELLGTGGMGMVYSGTDLRLNRPVALKFLNPFSDPQTRQSLIDEARAASLLDHPNICTIFEIETTDEGDVFIVMALYEGETLDRILAQDRIEIDRAISIGIQTARGLAAAHEALLIHRDIKPANLMITRDDTVKILDFGLAIMVGERDGNGMGTVIGTPQYMSPEQLRGEPLDQRTDVWSLGVVLYEMLAGRPPFQGRDIPALIQSVLQDSPPPVSSLRAGISTHLDQIIGMALARDPGRRFEKIETMARELQLAQSALDSGAITLRLPATKPKTSIAVLPFEDMSPTGDHRYLCEGIAEEILRALNRIPDLYVASRTSTFQYKNIEGDIREIGKRLNVNTILEGSVRRAGDRIRISAQLVNVENNYLLWYQRYDREMKDIFMIEDEIAGQIAEALQVKLKDNLSPSNVSVPANEAEAYELYLQGRQFFHQHRRKALEIALQTFSQAIELSPNYARAYAGIADCNSFLHLYFGHGAEAVDAADRASAKALELDPSLSDAHASRGLALFLRRQFNEAEEKLRRAIELDPRHYDPHYIFGRVCFSQGRISEAAYHFRHACEIVTEAYDSWYLLGMCYRRLGETAQVVSAELDCIEAVKRRVRYHPDDTRAWTMGASALAKRGEPERAAEWIARALAIDADEPIIEYNAACVYVALGKNEEALNCLEASLGLAAISKDWLINDPDLDPLRDDPRFEKLLQRFGMTTVSDRNDSLSK